MADTNFRGPVSAMGSLEINAGTTASVELLDGPSGFYQGAAFADIRGYPFQKDGTAPGRQAGFLGYQLITVDGIPQATATNVIVAAASYVTATANLTIIAAGVSNSTQPSQNIAVQVPILPMGTSVITTAPMALDFGFSSGTCTANSSAVAVTDNTKFQVGQWICIGNAGNAAGTASLLAQVLSIATANFTGINVSPSPAVTINAPIGQADLFGSSLYPPSTQFGPNSPVPVRVAPDLQAGLYKIHNPAEMLARNVSITVQAIASSAQSWTALVTGWDAWKQYMTEVIPVSVTSTSPTFSGYGKKAFKFINSINVTMQTTSTVSVGIGDTFGFPIRADYPSQAVVYAGSTTVVSAVGFTAAVSTSGSPATNTTGDVRGTIQLSGAGAATAITSAATTLGTTRLTIIQNISPWNMIAGTPLNTVPIFGNQQSST